MAVGGNDHFDMWALTRLTSWGTGAALALALAVITGMSATGARRASVAIAAWSGDGEPPRQVAAARLVPRSSDLEGETRRLNEAIRLLAADRDRLLTRIGSIERNLDDMTGSVNRTSASSQPAAAPKPQAPATIPAAAAPAVPAVAPTWMANGSSYWPRPSSSFPAPSRVTSAPATGDNAPTGSIATKMGFGVDIGGAANLEGLKQLWNAAKSRHAALLNGLRPIVSIRESTTGEMDLRLIVGPLANAAAAAKLCATLGAADVLCQTTVFDGQRLALR